MDNGMQKITYLLKIIIKRVEKFIPVSNAAFRRLFFKNCCLVMAAVLGPLLVALGMFYISGSHILANGTENAQQRALDNTSATLNTVFAETDYTLKQYVISSDVIQLVSIRKARFPDYDYFALTHGIINKLIDNRRIYLDYRLSLYSSQNDYLLSTTSGAQTHIVGYEREIITTYEENYENAEDTHALFCLSRLRTEYVDLKKHTLSFYRNIFDRNGEVAGFIVADLDTDNLSQYLTEDSNISGSILITDTEGNLMFDSSGDLLQNQALLPIADWLPTKEDQNHFINSSSGSQTVQLGNKNIRMDWTTGNYLGMKYVQMIPYDEYAQSMKQLRQRLYSITLPALMLALILAYWVSRRLFQPLEKILLVVSKPNMFESQKDEGEIHFLLMSILDIFQRNMALVEENIQRQSALKQARIRALQKQIGPHFLNNALQSINWLAINETGEEDSATSRSIMTVAALSRYCMESESNWVTVNEEVQYVKNYMNIQQLRFGPELTCHYDIDREAGACLILRLFLQPLVENSINHGILPNDGGKGNIYVKIQLIAREMLYMAVEDDGQGMKDEQIEQFNELCGAEFIYSSQHVGLINLNQRIQLSYGPQHALRLSHSKYGGLKVDATIPVTQNDPPEQLQA